MAYRKRKNYRRRLKPQKRTKRRKRTKKRVMKKKLTGFTKEKGKYRLVFKKGKKLSLGKSKYSSKKSMDRAAVKYL